MSRSRVGAGVRDSLQQSPQLSPLAFKWEGWYRYQMKRWFFAHHATWTSAPTMKKIIRNYSWSVTNPRGLMHHCSVWPRYFPSLTPRLTPIGIWKVPQYRKYSYFHFQNRKCFLGRRSAPSSVAVSVITKEGKEKLPRPSGVTRVTRQPFMHNRSKLWARANSIFEIGRVSQ